MTLENCPKCGKQLLPPLKSSGRQVCTSCGFSDKQKIVQITSPDPIPKSNPSNSSPAKNFSLKFLNFLNKTELILLAIFIGLIFANFSKPSYEYRVVSPSDLGFEESMNDYGSQGWKTIECRRAKDSDTDNFSYECILIREKKLTLK